VAGESNSGAGCKKNVPNYTIANDYWALTLDPQGNILQDFVYGGDGAEYLVSAIPLPGGGFLLGGSTNSSATGDVSDTLRGIRDYWMIRLDAGGNKVWDRIYGGTGADVCNRILPTADGGFMMAGYTLSPMDGDVSEPPKGIRDYWIVKTDSAGLKQWDKRYGGDSNSSSFGTWIEQAAFGRYWLAGYTDSGLGGDVSEPTYGGSDYWVLLLDTSGAVLWDKRFGGPAEEFLGNLVVLQDSSVVLCGHSDAGSSAVKTAPSKGWWDYWMVAFKYTLPVGLTENSPRPSLQLHPSPGDGLFHLSLSVPGFRIADLTVTDVTGKTLLRTRWQPGQTLDLRAFEAGVYFVQAAAGDAVYTGKAVKQ
jgi:hypothetical protein